MEGININRRTLLTTVGAGSMLALAGCSGDGSGDGGSSDGGGSENGSNTTSENDSNTTSENGTSSNDSGQAENDSEETQDVAQRGAGENVLENAGLVIREHEVVEGDYDVAVEGIVENTTDEVKDYVEVQVRAYDADGNQLDSYLDNTTNLQAGGTWKFSVSILDYEEMEEYDIAVTDSAL